MIPYDQDLAATDREIALRRLGGDEKLLAALAGFFLEDAPALMVQLNDAQRAGDMTIAAIRAHSLKGLSATFEAIPFKQLAAEIESFARAGDQGHLEQSLPQLKIEFDRLVADLQTLVH